MGIIINVALCEGRYEISQATDGCVYGSIADITDIAKLEEEAVAFIGLHGVTYDKYKKLLEENVPYFKSLDFIETTDCI